MAQPNSCTGWTLAACAALALTACPKSGGEQGGTSAPAQEAPDTSPRKPIDAATTATITGVVLFKGTLPAPTMIQASSDAACAKENPGEFDSHDVAVKDGKVENAFVWVKSGLDRWAYPPAAGALHVEQKGCMYRPRVFGVRVGQEIEFSNADQTIHNIASKPKVAKAFNFVTPQGQSGKRSFNKPEVMVRIGCDVHPWMRAYSGVVDHPYFAVSGADGSFRLPGIPAGTYTLGVWSERLGETELSVTLAAKETKPVELTLPGTKAEP